MDPARIFFPFSGSKQTWSFACCPQCLYKLFWKKNPDNYALPAADMRYFADNLSTSYKAWIGLKPRKKWGGGVKILKKTWGSYGNILFYFLALRIIDFQNRNSYFVISFSKSSFTDFFILDKKRIHSGTEMLSHFFLAV